MKTNRYIFFTAIAVVLGSSCAVKNTLTPLKNNEGDLSAIKISLQEKKIFAFASEGVFFSNNFASARLNQLHKVNDSTFNIVIESENSPINPSPWFAFKIWGTPGKNVYINLNYPTAKHRYQPKISNDGTTWHNLNEVIVTNDKKKASFSVQLGTDTLIVAAQEIISSRQSYAWMDSLATKNALERKVIGYSIGGKPIVALTSTKSNGKKLVVVLSRQHPPEVSGYMAMTAFVETLLNNATFIKEFELVMFPMVNPDGVDEGNWRHSLGGVDLNRDWMDFKQPETRAIKAYLLAKVKEQDAKVYFALDFHSTFYDILYTNIKGRTTHTPGLVDTWIKGLHDFEGANKTRVEASTDTNNLSKAWLGRELNAEAVIYEVGDNTPRPHIKEKAKKAADILIDALLKK